MTPFEFLAYGHNGVVALRQLELSNMMFRVESVEKPYDFRLLQARRSLL